ncbi:hypothetical protein [Ornithinibacillus californiensis]|uniref:hypothetical protein n=1 Tax=Ornithinibacillus californiensis TaxID=161536 RepID=UPI00064DECC0|nr:hypothetical protein [Ornithinibacillus californiensis]
MLVKRFWKLITLTIVIIVVLIAYFIQTSLVVANQFPELELKTISGDESVIKNIQISGDYYDQSNYSSAVMVTDEGSTYREKLSYFEYLEATFPPNEVASFKDEYRNFMRNKWMSPSSYFDNEEYLAYVGVDVATERFNTIYHHDYFFEVDVLNKTTNKSNAFKIKVPGQADYSDVQVMDVQLVNGELKVVTDIGYYHNEQHVYELMVYTIDLSTNKITGDDTLLAVENNEEGDWDGWTDISLLNDYRDISEQKYLLLQKSENKKPESVSQESHNEDGVVEAGWGVTDRAFFLYNLETEEFNPINLSDIHRNELLSTDDVTGHMNDSHAYITYVIEGKLKVLDIRLDDFSVGSDIVFNWDELDISDATQVKMNEDKIYVMERFKNYKDPAKVIVGDMATGDLLYEGEIVMKDVDDETENYELQFYNMVIN